MMRFKILATSSLSGLTLALAVLATAADDDPAEERGKGLADTVRTAFRETHQGYSSDEILIDDELNRAFIAACRKQKPDASETDLNWTLLNLRKSGHLDVPATKRRTHSHDEYLQAAEIAARFLYDKHRQSIDQALCDPKLRAEFDRLAHEVAPEVSAYRLRKAGLALRKSRRLRPELVTRVAAWDREVSSLSAEQIINDEKLLPDGPGVYIFRDPSGYLYIGESSNLRRRVAQHLDASDRQALVHYLRQNGAEEITVEIHAFDPKSDARFKEMRRAYESELIRSRQPKLNLAP